MDLVTSLNRINVTDKKKNARLIVTCTYEDHVSMQRTAKG